MFPRRPQSRYPSYRRSTHQRPYLDIKEHVLLLHRQVLPLFFLLCALTMVIFIAVRAGQRGANLPDPGYIGAPVGLLSSEPGAIFDPAFAVLSPIELTLAPEAEVLSPYRALPEAEALAVGDGRVVYAAKGKVILTHNRLTGIVQTTYSGLASMRIGVGSLVDRASVLGVFGKDPTAIRVETRAFPVLAFDDTKSSDSNPPVSTEKTELTSQPATNDKHSPPRSRTEVESPLKLKGTQP